MSENSAHDYPELNEKDADPNPFRQFERWFKQAEVAIPILPNAMTLATASATVSMDGVPSARVVLLKDFDERGFVFYTNYESPKGKDLDQNAVASLCFYWAELGRQVRITGTVSRTSREESEAYFHTRPVDSQLGAWASNQSEVISSREVLEERMEELVRKYEGKQIPLPPNWGGYRVAPSVLEFWQSRPSRLHDRLRYSRREREWVIERLAP